MSSKKAVADLAIFGGHPAFDEKLHVGRPNIGDRQRFFERVNNILDRRWLTNLGPYVQEFERKVAERLGVKHCVTSCNGTMALGVAVRAAGLKGEVIIPSFTFVATAHALQWQGITPVFCDIDPKTHNLDPIRVREMITPSTTGIIGVHMWGRPCNIDALTEIARQHHLTLMFDAAFTFGCSYQGRMIGNFGQAEALSFHATKFFNTFEGGAVVTNDDDLAARVRLMTNFGFAGYDKVVQLGTNGKMSEVSAAMGLTSLESLDEFVAVNRRNYHQYRQGLSDLPGVHLIHYDEDEQCNYQYIILEIDQDTSQLSRDQLQDVLRAENVLARRYFYPGCHRMEPYRSSFPHGGPMLPHTDWLSGRVLALPTGTAVGGDDIHQICEIVRFAIMHGHEVRRRLEAGEARHL